MRWLGHRLRGQRGCASGGSPGSRPPSTCCCERPARSIGSSRCRCLAKLRRHLASAALTRAEPASMPNEPPGPSRNAMRITTEAPTGCSLRQDHSIASQEPLPRGCAHPAATTPIRFSAERRTAKSGRQRPYDWPTAEPSRFGVARLVQSVTSQARSRTVAMADRPVGLRPGLDAVVASTASVLATYTER
jgi:hypothetical protein